MKLPEYKNVIKKANQVLAENCMITAPISPRDIADNYGIKIADVIFGEKHKEVAGFLDFKENKIYVNSEDPYNRKTFTIAHELGHFFLHRNYFEENPEQYQVLLRRPIGAANDALEKEANTFAAHLLVPSHLLEKYIDFASIEMLATLFVVSEDVIRIRIKYR